MKKGENVKWVDGVGFEHKGIVARDTDSDEFMIPVEQRNGIIIRIAYKDLSSAPIQEIPTTARWYRDICRRVPCTRIKKVEF